MNKKIIILIFSFLMSISLYSSEEMPERWHQLMTLIDKERKTILSLREISPQLKQRLLELDSETLNLLKQKENQKFLKASPVDIKNKGRDFYFSESIKLQLNAEKFGLDIIKNFPRFINNAEIYYTLALNSRDYGKNNKTEQFLLQALKIAHQRSAVNYNAKVALAEYYYNNNKYDTAIKYYNEVLKNTGDEWHTKHLYNAAWCFLKKNDFNYAIDLLVKAHDLGLQSRYISMKDQVLESAQAFFVLGDRIDDGIAFYLKNAVPPTSYLIRMASRTAERGQFDKTELIIQKNLEVTTKLEKFDLIGDIHLQQLEIYRNFKRHDLHFKTARSLEQLKKKNLLSEQQTEDAIQKITELVGFLQIRLTNNAKIKQSSFDPELLKMIITYFDFLTTLDPNNKDKHSFFQGESFFAVELYKDAAKAYRIGLEAAKTKVAEAAELETMRRKILESLLATLEFGKFNKEEQQNLTIYTFTHYLEYWPVDEKSRLIYRNLFNLYFQLNRIDQGLAVLNAYQKHYTDTDNREIQRGMLTQVIDQYIKEKNSDRLAFWISKINEGFLNFPKTYTEKAVEILGQILFENYSAMASAGKKNEAILGYKQVFEDERYPAKIKAQASFRMAVLLQEEHLLVDSYHWLEISLNLYSKAELAELRPALLALHEIYYTKQHFEFSTKLADRVLSIYCNDLFEKKDLLFTNSLTFKLLSNRNNDAAAQIQQAGRCPLVEKPEDHKTIVENSLQRMIQFYLTERKYKEFFSLYPAVIKMKDISHQTKEVLDRSIVNIYWDSFHTGSVNMQKSIYDLFKKRTFRGSLNSSEKEMSLILSFHEFQNDVNSLRLAPLTQSNPFDDELFSQELEANINLISLYTKRADGLLKSGHPEINLLTSEIITKLIIHFSQKLAAYRPLGVPPEFVTSFVDQIGPVAVQLKENGLKYSASTKGLITQHQLLTSFNQLYLQKEEWKNIHELKFDPAPFLVPMTSIETTRAPGSQK